MLTREIRPYRRLAAAVVLQAVKDGRGNGPLGLQGRMFLSSESCADLVDLTGLDTRMVENWIAAGCPRRDPIRLFK